MPNILWHRVQMYLSLTDDGYDQPKQADPTIKKYTRQWPEYGKSRQGYWTSEIVTKQTRDTKKNRHVKFTCSWLEDCDNQMTIVRSNYLITSLGETCFLNIVDTSGQERVLSYTETILSRRRHTHLHVCYTTCSSVNSSDLWLVRH